SHLFPKSLVELQNGKEMRKLSRMARDKEKPTQYLCACLHRMIMGLDVSNTEENLRHIQRIYILLTVATTFVNNNYYYMASLIYTVTHEISLLMIRQLSQQHPLVSY